MSATTISAEDFLQLTLQSQDIHVIDVRTPEEYRARRLSRARNVPLGTLDAPTCQDLACADQSTIYILCGTGKRASMACQALQEHSELHTVVITGGIEALGSAGAALDGEAR